MQSEIPDQVWRPDVPWNALPALPPVADVESKAVLKLCIAARAALAELKAAAESIPNQGILLQMLPMLEAKASSEIENIVTTADDLFRFADRDRSTADSATREALRYRAALAEGYDSLAERPLSTSTAVTVCRAILGSDIDIRRVPGTALAGYDTGSVIYTPPQGESRLRDLLSNWEGYLHEQRDIDPLIRMAVAHYQFEAIHPFTDGNGRTGRILNVLFLIEQDLLDLPILYLSRYINANRTKYYRLLLAITQADAWEEWICFMLRGVYQTATWTVEKIIDLRRLERETIAHIRQERPKIYSRELVDLIFAQPYCRISNVCAAGIAKRETAARYLSELVSIGVLQEYRSQKERLFANRKLIDLFTNED
jgi:Fic family protein